MTNIQYFGNPLTSIQKHLIADDSLLFKRGRSAAKDYRTIMIENIPSDIHLLDIMSVIKGDGIFSGQLLQTTSITGSLTARIVFLEQRFAFDFMHKISQKPGSSQIRIASAYLVATPTWPIPSAVYSMGLFEVATRCLNIRNAPSDLTAEIIYSWLDAEECTNPLNSPLIKRNGDELLIWFSSVAAASRGRYILSHNSHSKDLEMGYYADSQLEMSRSRGRSRERSRERSRARSIF